MSSALLRKSLEIVESENKSKNKKKSKSKGVFDLIPSNHTNFKTVGRGGKIEKRTLYKIGDGRSKKYVTPKDSQTKIEENLSKLKALIGTSLGEETAQKIVKRAKLGRALIEIEEEKQEEGTVFTEEDFKNFEKDLAY